MEPVPYEIREEDVDEVLNAYEPMGGGDWPEDTRREARRHVMRSVVDLDEIVRSVPEDDPTVTEGLPGPAGAIAEHPGDAAPARREMALAAIEDLLIRDGFIELDPDETRVFPATTTHDTERAD